MPTKPRPFLSYARADWELVSQLYEILIGLGCDPILDRMSFPTQAGRDWENVRDESIATCDSMYLVVTKSIFENPNSHECTKLRQGIETEIQIALAYNKTIGTIIAQDGEWFDRLIKKPSPNGGLLIDSQAQAIDIVSSLKNGKLTPSTCRRALWRIAAPFFKSRIEQRRDEAVQWAHSQVDPFNEMIFLPLSLLDAWKNAQGEPSTIYSILAPGGEGKSVLMARRILNSPTACFPILIPLDALESNKNMAELLGVPSLDLLDEATSIARRSWNIWIEFYVDALEKAIAPPGRKEPVNGEPTEYAAFALIAQLQNCAPLFITARPEVWSTQLKWMLSQENTIPIDGIAASRLDEFIPDCPQNAKRILTNALFIEWYRRRPTTEIAGLGYISKQFAFFHDLLGLGQNQQRTDTLNGGPTQAQVLEALAAIQLSSSSYSVSRGQLLEILETSGFDFAASNQAIGSIKIIRVDKNAVRLSHDLLDAANCVHSLMITNQLNAWIDRDLRPTDIAILQMYFELKADFHRLNPAKKDAEHEVHEVFDLLLRMLDIKPRSMYRGWCATWVLEGLMRPQTDETALDLVLRAINGTGIDDLDLQVGAENVPLSVHDKTVEYSTIQGQVRRTRLCLSSLTSLWRVFQRGRAPLPHESIPALASVALKTEHRFRAIEGLAKYNDPEATDAIIRVGNQVLDEYARGKKADLDVLGKVAVALSATFRSAEVEELLARIEECPSLSLRNRRLSKQARTGQVYRASAEEMAEELQVDDRRGDPTDWMAIEEYCNQVMQQAGSVSDIVLEGLSRTIYHKHPPVAAKSASALGRAGGLTAVRSLTASFLREEGSPTYWGALMGALNEVAERLPAEIRAALLHVLPEVQALGDTPRTEAIESLLKSIGGNEGSIVIWSLDARPPVALTGPLAKTFPWRLRGAGPTSWLRARTIAARVDPSVVGVGIESKLQIALEQEGAGWSPFLVPSRWEEARGFHIGLSQARASERAEVEIGLALGLQGFASSLPGLAAAHILVRTSDGLIVATQRARHLKYWPDHWSLSLEEQIVPSDYDPASPDGLPAAVAARALSEEIPWKPGLCPSVREIHIERSEVYLEAAIVNICLVLVVRLPHTRADFLEALTSNPRGQREVQVLRCVTPDQANNLDPLHPTSRLRLALALETS